MPDVFINYRSDDEAGVAILIDKELCARIGPERVFRDNRSIPLGRDFRPELWGSLAKSVVLVVVIGRRWLARDKDGRRRVDDPEDFVRREIATAFQIGIHVVPVLVGEVPVLRAEHLPDDIAKLAYQQYRRLSIRGIQRDLPPLIEELAVLAGAASSETTDAWTAARDGTVLMLRPESPVRDGHVEALHKAVDRAAADAEIPAIEMVTRPGGLTVFVPASVPAIRVLSRLVSALESALTDRSARDGGPLRARAGLHHWSMRRGQSDVCDEITHILDHPTVGEVRRRATKAGLVVVLPDIFYEGVVRAHPLAADPSTYLPVSIAGGSERFWVHTPGYPSPPGIRTAADTPDGGPRPARGSGGGPGGVQFTNHGPVYGPQVGGDWVNGTKIVNGHEAGHQ